MVKTLKATPSGLSLGSLLLRVCLLTLLGGLFFAGTAYCAGQSLLALGFLLGALLSPLNLLSLNSLVSKVLRAGEAKGRNLFWVLQAFRWISFAVIIGVLIQISFLCLLGALASYTWFLGVLAWIGARSALPKKNNLPADL